MEAFANVRVKQPREGRRFKHRLPALSLAAAAAQAFLTACACYLVIRAVPEAGWNPEHAILSLTTFGWLISAVLNTAVAYQLSRPHRLMTALTLRSSGPLTALHVAGILLAAGAATGADWVSLGATILGFLHATEAISILRQNRLGTRLWPSWAIRLLHLGPVAAATMAAITTATTLQRLVT
ncbi:hypothetical protein ACX80W_14730 [Arthrobacter sp. TMN-37]